MQCAVEVFSVQCRVYNVQCGVYRVQCGVYNVQCRVYNVQCRVYNVQCRVYSVQCRVYNVQCRVYNVQCTMCSAQLSNAYLEMFRTDTEQLLPLDGSVYKLNTLSDTWHFTLSFHFLHICRCDFLCKYLA